MYIQGGVTMIAQLKAWGNSQGIRLSKELLTLAGIKNNDILEIELQDGNIVLKKAKKGTSYTGRTGAGIWWKAGTV